MSTTSEDIYKVAFTAGKVWAGLLNESMSQVGSIGLNGSDPQAMSMTDPTDGVTKMWAVDQTDSLCIDVLNDEVKHWGTLVNLYGEGTIPTRCALVCRYRGRAVLARQPNNTAIYYMSRVLNPLDFDYGASPVNTAAIAGSDPRIGQPGDSIVALIAWLDDYLIFGCKSSLYWMVGDPGDGGNVQLLSNNTGVMQPNSWCFDDNGVLYFMGPKGLYRFLPAAGSKPLCISDKRLPLLDQIDSEANRVTMAFDYHRRWVLIAITPLDGSQGTHVIYDPAGDAFFTIQFPAVHGPWSMCGVVGANDEDRRILMGGDDGYVRKFSATAMGDDGHAITCEIDFAPVALRRGSSESIATEIQAAISDGTDGLGWQWHSGPSAEEVHAQDDSEAAESGEWSEGFNEPVGLRSAGGFHQLRLRQESKDETFALEEVQAVLSEAGRRRA